MKREDIIHKQQWGKKTLNHLMEFFIESHELGEQFDDFLLDTARKENEAKNLQRSSGRHMSKTNTTQGETP